MASATSSSTSPLLLDDRVESLLLVLRFELSELKSGYEQMQQQSLSELLESLRHQIHNFEKELRYLSTFLQYVSEWSCDQSVVQNLRPLVTHIRDAEDEIFHDLVRGASNLPIHDQLGHDVISDKKRTHKLMLRNLIGEFPKMLKKIELLKPVIREAYDHHLSNPSFEAKSVLERYYELDGLLIPIKSSLRHLPLTQPFIPDHLYGEIKAIGNQLWELRGFLHCLIKIFPEVFHDTRHFQDFMGYVGSVGIRAAHVSCFCWVRRGMDEDVARMSALLLDLKLKTDPTNPEFLELAIKLLMTFRRCMGHELFQILLKAFVKYLNNGREDILIHRSLIEIISFVIDERPDQDLHSFTAEIKALVREVRCLKLLLCTYCTTRYERRRSNSFELCWQCRKSHGLFNLFARIWLLETEIFLVKQIRSDHKVIDMGNLNQGMRILRVFFADSPEEITENGKQIMKFTETVSGAIAPLRNSFFPMPLTENRVRNDCLWLLFKTVLCRAEFRLMELITRYSDAILMVPVQDQLKSLHEGLKFLWVLLTWHPDDGYKEENYLIFSYAKAAARVVISLCDTFTACKIINEETLEKANLLITDSLGKISLVKVELKKMFCPPSRSYFPKTHSGRHFMNGQLRNLRELLDKYDNSIAILKHQMEEILDGLELLGSFPMNILEEEIEHEYLDDLGKCISGAAYEAEYVIESSVLGNVAERWKHLLWLIDLQEKIRIMKVQVTRINNENTKEEQPQNGAQALSHSEIQQEKTHGVEDHSLGQSLRHARSHKKKIQYVEDQNISQDLSIISLASTLRTDEVVVGLDDHQEKIVYQLIQRVCNQRDIVSIVGMPGIGKTTLAGKVYNDPRITHHFHVRAWCHVSPVYDYKQVLLDILGYLIELTQDIRKMSKEDLEAKLYRELKGRRYLIVMDNIWSTALWDDLGRVFPDDGNRSMVLITTRHLYVASKVKPGGGVHEVCLLSDDESWTLLRTRIFQGKGCPVELLEVGMKIAKNCQGLPLALVTIAGLLKTNREGEWWKQIAENLNAHMQCKDIIELSYRYLPNYLKACYLYFGAFLGDNDIAVRRLVWLWIAEGLVQETKLKSLEDLAEDYLMDLIGRGLVMVTKRRSNGRVKACRVHDMLLDLCRSNAEKENFLQLITCNDEPYASFERFDNSDDFGYYPRSPVAFEAYRLCICVKRKHFLMSRPFSPCAHSLLLFATNEKHPTRTCDISFVPNNFKLLRVLDLECVNLGNVFPDGMQLLVLLRYLAVSGEIETVPSIIAKLWNLCTFLVKGLSDKVRLPASIWTMERLRHIHVNDYAVFDKQEDKLGSFCQLHNLVTLSSVCFSYGEDADKIVARMPNLRNLTCMFFESRGNSGKQYPRLDLLSHLESVSINHIGKAREIGDFNFPSNLKRLTLSNFRLPWDQISVVGRLQNLEVLKLLSRAFEGKIWDMKEGEFPELKFLKLDSLNIVQWNLSSDHLPNLQQLVLRRCNHLEGVPDAFMEMPTLQMIEVRWCGKFVEESIRKFEEEGIEGLKILIDESYSGLR